MGRRLIVDTGVLIAGERGKLDFAKIIQPEDDAAIPAVAVAEFRVGILLATASHSRLRREFLEQVLAVLPVIDYTAETAATHAELLVHARRLGVVRGAHDLIIAATALATGRTILTTDEKAGFDQLPNVSAIVV